MGWGDRTGAEWARLEPHLPRNVGWGRRWKSHRRVVNGILFRLRTGIPWRDMPTRFGNWKTVYERHRWWSADGTWERMLRAVLAEGRIDWSMVSVDSTVCRAHQHAAGARRKASRKPRTRIRPAQHRPAGGRPRTCPDHLSGDKAYSSRRNRRYLWRWHIKHTIPERRDQQTHRRNRGSKGGRPTDFKHAQYARRREVEGTINRIKNSRAMATRYDKRTYVFHGTVTVAALRRWLRP
ncbi:IS5 family transposase [Streptomyces sp. WAC 06725]|uniref:IS5 family transposase n=1 Tax=Streptomyces sp. WAC 06725 TaxID=2203209 RepID=UPI000F73EB81|nr:IS5 family transposase [Streptomyces sp. WAC 06725]RSO36192.1 IS5 family transposase [Streptomyces sp. WAC 06725]